MKAHFYEKEIEHKDSKGKLVKTVATLHFRLEVPSKADVGAVPFVFDGVATEAHKSEYAGAYRAFLKSKEIDSEMVEASAVPADSLTAATVETGPKVKVKKSKKAKVEA